MVDNVIYRFRLLQRQVSVVRPCVSVSIFRRMASKALTRGTSIICGLLEDDVRRAPTSHHGRAMDMPASVSYCTNVKIMPSVRKETGESGCGLIAGVIWQKSVWQHRGRCKALQPTLPTSTSPDESSTFRISAALAVMPQSKSIKLYVYSLNFGCIRTLVIKISLLSSQ